MRSELASLIALVLWNDGLNIVLRFYSLSDLEEDGMILKGVMSFWLALLGKTSVSRTVETGDKPS